jgi:hypothetical protein
MDSRPENLVRLSQNYTFHFLSHYGRFSCRVYLEKKIQGNLIKVLLKNSFKQFQFAPYFS